jgi:hypothetical protein
MKWLEKNWLIVLGIFVAYLWYNGSLGNLLGTGTAAAATNGNSNVYSGPMIMGG